MKAVILAGGLGTRLSEETTVKPKPMVEVGGMPILWHIMKIYSSHGINDFVICCGYKGEYIKKFFADYALGNSDVTFDLQNNSMELLRAAAEPWKVTLIDTGADTLTGGRLLRVKEHVKDDTFCFTYGDGVADVNITELVNFHKRSDSLTTLTAVRPPGRFGAIILGEKEHKIASFQEKPQGDGAWINGGFFVVEPEAIDYITDDTTTWEQEPLQRLAREGQLSGYQHSGFWQPMDTLRDKNHLESLWDSGNPPWKCW